MTGSTATNIERINNYNEVINVRCVDIGTSRVKKKEKNDTDESIFYVWCSGII